ncbi:Vld1p NDAI_0H01500 [Naumovozyma dairenensis CBS 421]|uniref:DUF1746 domain-containing protein n=1 Tax=Naumovozyma dairenensis (strain ATCC 10597 / BCRC 20456 / CBS 421 / NBRC 0211 / NRRL Y-12639) TaxID=1071378 RepID=G0WEW3_NAUDC|nr:hypothetical protein NDAI_0H01500 [Naumovozyma dairenensis CBS 421]CCD26324.1 hypothetical protein NDAI_0H01500 [Naumovozyma dairenensis CBS 421]
MDPFFNLFIGQIELVCYTLIFIRFVKDNSMILGFIAILILQLSKFNRDLLSKFLSFNIFLRETENENSSINSSMSSDPDHLDHVEDETIRTIMYKIIHLLQSLIVLQTIYGIIYHAKLDIATDVCSYKFGFFFLNLIGNSEEEYNCLSKQNNDKTIFWLLDFILLTVQLTLVTLSLNPELSINNINEEGRRTSLDLSDLRQDLETNGILSILCFQQPTTTGRSSSSSSTDVVTGQQGNIRGEENLTFPDSVNNMNTNSSNDNNNHTYGAILV